jgi:restriction system protein
MGEKFTVQLAELPQEPAAEPAADKPTLATAGPLSFTEAAQRVLTENGSPLHFREITAAARRKGYLDPLVKHADLSMAAALTEEVRRSRQRGDTPVFSTTENGAFGLSVWERDAFHQLVAERNAAACDKLLGRLRTMDPGEFEDYIGALLTRLGFTPDSPLKSFDGNIETTGTLTVGGTVELHMAVHIRRYGEGEVIGPDLVKQLRGSLDLEEQGLLVTTSDFSAPAKDEAAMPGRKHVSLMNGKQLVALMLEHGIGVESTTLKVFEVV